MLRRSRNLRLPSSSDEDETPLNSNRNRPQPTPPPSLPLEISDDEEMSFFDAPDDFSAPNHTNLSNSNLDLIKQHLERLGLRLKQEWMIRCVSELERAGLGFERLDFNGKAKLCFQQLLFHDLNYFGAGVLPGNVSGMHNVELKGPFVLQVDEVVNICTPLRERYHKASAGPKRCLKLSLTDGVQRVFGMEYRPIRDLDVTAPVGYKIIVRDIQIRRGLLVLVPEVMEILGGMVESLEEAHKRLVHELDKPPRGKRKRGNNTLPLAERASLAAWASTTVENGSHPLNVSTPQISDNAQLPAQVTLPPARIISEASVVENHDPSNGTNNIVEAFAQTIQESNTASIIAPYASRVENNWSANTAERVDHVMEENIFIERRETTTSSFTSRDANENNTAEKHNSTAAPIDHIMEENICIERRETTTSSFASRDANENNTAEKQNSTTQTGIVYKVDDPSEFVANVSDGNADTGIQTPCAIEADGIDMEDAVTEVENPLVLDGGREIPFTYLASLLAKWATKENDTHSIRGKCTLTGVKGFQFRNQSIYELHVYIDDGSLISEIIISHDVVEKCIGYSPEEVNNALSSTDNQVAINMKETMKKFQLFLTKFEGIIVIEISEDSSYPIALEMNQGCSVSDGWMLLQRLKQFTAVQNLSYSLSNTINLSP